MLPPDEYERAAQQADYHIQIEIQGVTHNTDHAQVTGRVVRVFRGTSELLNRNLLLEVPTLSFEDQINAPPDGITRVSKESIRPRRILEALVNTGSGKPEIPLGLCAILRDPTDTPQLMAGPRLAPNTKRTVLLVSLIIAIVIATGFLLFLH
jgi:hypothetical protein